MLNLVYNMLYFDKYKYLKIVFEKVAFVFAPDFISEEQQHNLFSLSNSI